jgi:hypothetical protein
MLAGGYSPLSELSPVGEPESSRGQYFPSAFRGGSMLPPTR